MVLLTQVYKLKNKYLFIYYNIVLSNTDMCILKHDTVHTFIMLFNSVYIQMIYFIHNTKMIICNFLYPFQNYFDRKCSETITMVISIIYFTCDSPPHIFYFVLTVINNNILGV